MDMPSCAIFVQFKVQMIELCERFVLQEVVEIINLPIFPCIHGLYVFSRVATEGIGSKLKVAYAFRYKF
jgi:hypothetical protein